MWSQVARFAVGLEAPPIRREKSNVDLSISVKQTHQELDFYTSFLLVLNCPFVAGNREHQAKTFLLSFFTVMAEKGAGMKEGSNKFVLLLPCCFDDKILPPARRTPRNTKRSVCESFLLAFAFEGRQTHKKQQHSKTRVFCHKLSSGKILFNRQSYMIPLCFFYSMLQMCSLFRAPYANVEKICDEFDNKNPTLMLKNQNADGKMRELGERGFRKNLSLHFHDSFLELPEMKFFSFFV